MYDELDEETPWLDGISRKTKIILLGFLLLFAIVVIGVPYYIHHISDSKVDTEPIACEGNYNELNLLTKGYAPTSVLDALLRLVRVSHVQTQFNGDTVFITREYLEADSVGIYILKRDTEMWVRQR